MSRDRLPAATDALVAEIADRFGIPVPGAWSELGGSRTCNLRLDHGDTLVARIHRRTTSPARLAALQAARRAVAAAGIPAVPPIPAPSGADSVRLDSGHLVELEPYVPWNERMNTVPLLEKGFAALARVHDALRTTPLPPEAAIASHANHILSEDAAPGTRRGAARMRTWNDPGMARLADAAVRHVDAVAAGEAEFAGRQLLQLAHGDFWDDNVLFRAGRLVALLDFDFMGVRPRIDDLALTAYFFLLEPGKDLPGTAERAQIRRFVDAYDGGTALKLSAAERTALPLAIARQPAWSMGRWILELDEPAAREHASHLLHELPYAQAVLAELPAWQEALTYR